MEGMRVGGRGGAGFDCSFTATTFAHADLDLKRRDAITVTDKFCITRIKKSHLNVTSAACLVATVNR